MLKQANRDTKIYSHDDLCRLLCEKYYWILSDRTDLGMSRIPVSAAFSLSQPLRVFCGRAALPEKRLREEITSRRLNSLKAQPCLLRCSRE